MKCAACCLSILCYVDQGHIEWRQSQAALSIYILLESATNEIWYTLVEPVKWWEQSAEWYFLSMWYAAVFRRNQSISKCVEYNEWRKWNALAFRRRKVIERGGRMVRWAVWEQSDICFQLSMWDVSIHIKTINHCCIKRHCLLPTFYHLYLVLVLALKFKHM